MSTTCTALGCNGSLQPLITKKGQCQILAWPIISLSLLCGKWAEQMWTEGLCVCCQVSEIHRVWALHPVLLALDYTAEDNKQIVDLLLQCLNNSSYLQADDVSGVSLSLSLFPSRRCVCLSDRCLSRPRGSVSWCFSSAGTSASSGSFTAPSRTSWPSSASKTTRDRAIIGTF